MKFIDPNYKPSKNDLVAEFRLYPAKNISFSKASENITKESSIGTWTSLSTMSDEIKTMRARVFEINEKENVVKIAYPIELFEINNISQVLSSIAGNIFGMKLIDNLRLQDVNLPDKMIKNFKGPQLGIEGIRGLLEIYKRPLLGTIVKPKLGLSSKEHAEVAYKAWKGGLDLVKCDENLTSQKFNPFKKRIKESLKMRKKVEKETGDKKAYMPNITSPVSEMKKRADFVIENGGRYVMIDILTVGWSGFQEMRDYLEGKNIAIHCHRAGHAAFTRNPKHGISMLTIAKLTRLIGGDQLHIGTANLGKMHGEKDEILEIEREIESEKIEEHKQVLEEDWLGMKKTLAVASGGLHPGLIPKLIERMGKNIICQAGGGCHGHPDGTENGAKAMRQALDAAMKNIKLNEYAKNHEELKKALEKWG